MLLKMKDRRLTLQRVGEIITESGSDHQVKICSLRDVTVEKTLTNVSCSYGRIPASFHCAGDQREQCW